MTRSIRHSANDISHISVYGPIKPIPETYSRAGRQSKIDDRYRQSKERKANLSFHVSVFERIPRLKITADIYLDKDGEEDKQYINDSASASASAALRPRCPLIALPSNRTANKDKDNSSIVNANKRLIEHEAIKKRYEDYRRQRLIRIKAKTEAQKKEGAEMGKYTPNYNAIYSNVHTVRISKPVSNKEQMEMILNRKLERQREMKEEYERLYKHKGNGRGLDSKESNEEDYPLDLNDNEDQSKPKPKPKAMPKSRPNESMRDIRSRLRVNQALRNTSIDKTLGTHSKGVSFDKLSGREHIRSHRHTERIKMIDYNPNKDYVLRNTKKTCKYSYMPYNTIDVHYGDDKTNPRLLKTILTRKAIFNYNKESGYTVMKVEETHHSKHKPHSYSFINKLIGI